MKKFKICMLGAFAVGKTSLVKRYVSGIFSEKYITTLGVKIDKKSCVINDNEIELIIWDLAGEDDFMEIRSSYLRGTSAALLVADGTRGETLDVAVRLKSRLDNEVGQIPSILLVNKSDLVDSWTIDREHLKRLENSDWELFETSAKDSVNVDRAFETLAARLIS